VASFKVLSSQVQGYHEENHDNLGQLVCGLILFKLRISRLRSKSASGSTATRERRGKHRKNGEVKNGMKVGGGGGGGRGK